MAGVEKNFRGEAHLSDGYSVGYLAQEPHLDSKLTVKEAVSEGVSEVVSLLKKFDQINARFAEELNDQQMEDLLAEQAKVQDRLDKLNAWNLDDRLNFAMEALRCPPSDASIKNLSGGEKKGCSLPATYPRA